MALGYVGSQGKNLCQKRGVNSLLTTGQDRLLLQSSSCSLTTQELVVLDSEYLPMLIKVQELPVANHPWGSKIPSLIRKCLSAPSVGV